MDLTSQIQWQIQENRRYDNDSFDRNELDIYLEYPVAWYREGHAAWSFIIVETQINMHS